MGSYKGYLKPYEELILAQASEGKGATEIAGMIYEAGARPLWNQQGKKWDVMLPLAAMVAYVIKRNNGPGAQPEMVPPAPPKVAYPNPRKIASAPRDGTLILVFAEAGGQSGKAWHTARWLYGGPLADFIAHVDVEDRMGWFICSQCRAINCGMLHRATHWLPLPPAP